MGLPNPRAVGGDHGTIAMDLGSSVYAPKRGGRVACPSRGTFRRRPRELQYGCEGTSSRIYILLSGDRKDGIKLTLKLLAKGIKPSKRWLSPLSRSLRVAFDKSTMAITLIVSHHDEG